MVTKTDSTVQAAIRIVLTWAVIWHWLVDCGVPRSEIERKLIKFLRDLYKQKSFRSGEQKSSLNHKKESQGPSASF